MYFDYVAAGMRRSTAQSRFARRTSPRIVMIGFGIFLITVTLAQVWTYHFRSPAMRIHAVSCIPPLLALSDSICARIRAPGL